MTLSTLKFRGSAHCGDCGLRDRRTLNRVHTGRVVSEGDKRRRSSPLLSPRVTRKKQEKANMGGRSEDSQPRWSSRLLLSPRVINTAGAGGLPCTRRTPVFLLEWNKNRSLIKAKGPGTGVCPTWVLPSAISVIRQTKVSVGFSPKKPCSSAQPSLCALFVPGLTQMRAAIWS